MINSRVKSMITTSNADSTLSPPFALSQHGFSQSSSSPAHHRLTDPPLARRTGRSQAIRHPRCVKPAKEAGPISPRFPGYKPTAAKTAEEYAKLDAEDESLARWKATLGIVPGVAAGDTNLPKVRLRPSGGTRIQRASPSGHRPHPRTRIAHAPSRKEDRFQPRRQG